MQNGSKRMSTSWDAQPKEWAQADLFLVKSQAFRSLSCGVMMLRHFFMIVLWRDRRSSSQIMARWILDDWRSCWNVGVGSEMLWGNCNGSAAARSVEVALVATSNCFCGNRVLTLLKAFSQNTVKSSLRDWRPFMVTKPRSVTHSGSSWVHYMHEWWLIIEHLLVWFSFF